ncbi:MAG: hypothetical protein F4Y33_09505 [Gemmatimonadales bacterium]|nr:hypothetical protein [Gemmatimonadales bacterium]
MGGEDAPWPQAVGARLDDRREGDGLGARLPAGALELALEGALVDPRPNEGGGGPDPGHRGVRRAPHAHDLGGGLHHAQTRDDLERVHQARIRIVVPQSPDQRCRGVETPDQGHDRIGDVPRGARVHPKDLTPPHALAEKAFELGDVAVVVGTANAADPVVVQQRPAREIVGPARVLEARVALRHE